MESSPEPLTTPPGGPAIDERDRNIALVSTLLLLVGMPIGYLPGSSGDVIGLIVLTLISVAMMVSFFLRLIPRERAAGRAARTGLIFGIVSILTVAVFWIGVPFPFGATAVALGLRERDNPSDRGRATAAVVLGGLAVLASFVALLVG